MSFFAKFNFMARPRLSAPPMVWAVYDDVVIALHRATARNGGWSLAHE